MKKVSASRPLFFAIFLATIGLIGTGLYMQNSLHLEPCAMCILQRYAFVAIALTAFIAVCHNPARAGVRIYALAIGFFSVAGGGVAARQAWMQRFPVKEVECGPGLEYMLNAFPITDILPMLFKGGGDCSKVQWAFLGGTIPEWALAWFLVFGLTAVYLAVRQPPSNTA